MHLRPYLGLALVFTGAILLIISYLLGWTTSNYVLLGGFFIIIIGVILHVRAQKRTEKY